MFRIRNEIDKLEQRLKSLVEGSLVHTPSASQFEKEIVGHLEEALREGVEIDSDGIKWVPDFYQIYISPQLSTLLDQDPNMIDSASEHLIRLCRQESFSIHTPVRIKVVSNVTSQPEQLTVRASITPTQIQETSAHITEGYSDNPTIPSNAYLIVAGNQVFSLTQPVINIGRRQDNHLVIDDPRVSRVHAQLRVIRGHYNVIDLNSSGGTYVNGIRKMQSILFPGDVISLAGFPLVFNQDRLSSQEGTQGCTEPFLPNAS